MSGHRRTSPYPSYEPVHEVPQPSYGEHQQEYGQDHGTVHEGQDPWYGYRSLADHDVYDRPFQAYAAEPAFPADQQPVYRTVPQDGYGGGYQDLHQDLHQDVGPGLQYDGHQDVHRASDQDGYGGVYRTAPQDPAPPAAALPQQRSAAAAPGPRAAARGHRRKPRKKRTGRAVTAGTALLLAAAAGWYTVGEDAAKPGVASADGAGAEGVAAQPTADRPSPTADPAARAADARQTETPAADRSERTDGSVAAIPGLGASFAGRIPAGTNQVVLASGEGKDANRSTVTLWTRTGEGRWLAGETWQGHNAFKGWTTDHNEGDLRSPIGVFSLTDAGGRKADPGSRLPYDRDSNFVVSGRGFAGEQLAGSFDYVVAIDYNRVPGNSPLDPRRPNGSTKGGGIWIHVDHGGPTHGCVSVPEDKMAELIRTLDPAAHPVIVMGDAGSLAA
ncbi:L,D-peptidoglycan transpeptidase YkuD, ErfK/YbiS/YcfS/YnhG family [Streptomyces sp. TLI_053]|nr:L,D-peptidoglycan transpeptidase YkuD, ErfK/YbiS/YcfS/YnhG family [Streptomyces sp. TLI_053]